MRDLLCKRYNNFMGLLLNCLKVDCAKLVLYPLGRFGRTYDVKDDIVERGYEKISFSNCRTWQNGVYN